MDLADIRQAIDGIDTTLLNSFVERMDIATEVAKSKIEMGKAVFDPARERSKLNNLASRAPERYEAQTITLFRLLMSMSKAEQQRYINELKGITVSQKAHATAAASDTPFPQTATVACQGVEGAYKAVMKPTEGTILTVARVASEEAAACGASEVPALWDVVLAAGQKALEDTPNLLPVLKKAGVVDAGGFGFITILEGMLDAMRGIHKERTVEQPARAAANFEAIRDEDITFTYCTEFIAERKDKARNVGRLRAILNDIGDSLVVVEDDDIVKVHVHTDQPNKALEEGLKFGPLLTVKIENMREQHTAKVIEGTADTPKERVIVPAEKKYGFVAVAAGEGLKSLFTDLGADAVVQGGQTMNPSTDDIIRAVDSVPAEVVFVLPNNKNIIMAAEQAVHLSEEKKLVVVPTKTIPQGISAMLAVDPDAEQDTELATAMTEAASHVRSGQVTYAARDSEFDGKKIKQGEYLSLSEGRLCASGRETSVLKKLVREMVSDDSAFATVIFGEGVTEEQAAEVENLLHKANKDMEISVINGGQPVYYYILSVE